MSSALNRFHIFIDPKCFDNFAQLALSSGSLSVNLFGRELDHSDYLLTTMSVSSSKEVSEI